MVWDPWFQTTQERLHGTVLCFEFHWQRESLHWVINWCLLHQPSLEMTSVYIQTWWLACVEPTCWPTSPVSCEQLSRDSCQISLYLVWHTWKGMPHPHRVNSDELLPWRLVWAITPYRNEPSIGRAPKQTDIQLLIVFNNGALTLWHRGKVCEQMSSLPDSWRAWADCIVLKSHRKSYINMPPPWLSFNQPAHLTITATPLQKHMGEEWCVVLFVTAYWILIHSIRLQWQEKKKEVWTALLTESHSLWSVSSLMNWMKAEAAELTCLGSALYHWEML